MEDLIQDLRYGVRILSRRPIFTGVAVLSLVLGIGANTAIFSVLNALLWRMPAVADPDRLVVLYARDVRNPQVGRTPLSHPNWQDYHARNRSFSGILGHDRELELSVRTGPGPILARGQLVSGNYFDVLGVRAALGRTFLPAEDREPGTRPVAVVSHAFWKTYLGADPAAAGRTLTINGSGYTVIGVAPEGFRGASLDAQTQLWIPMAMNRQIRTIQDFNWYGNRRALFVTAIGRLKPGVTLEQARDDVGAITQQLEREHPDENKGRGIELVPLARATLDWQINRKNLLTSTRFLFAVTGLVLLIACANVSNLLLAQAAARRREIAIRLAQGASRGRLVRQLLAESGVLAVPGGTLGLLLGACILKAVPILLPNAPALASIELPLDGRVLAFTLGISLLTGLLFGLVPALQATRPELLPALRNHAEVEAAARGFGLRGALVAGQVALSLVSLVAAGLFLRSLGEMQRIDPGFAADRLAALSFDVSHQGWDQATGEQFFRDVRERAAALPGADAATLAQTRPFRRAFSRSVFLEEKDDERDRVLVQVNAVDPGYFSVLGLPLVRGRAFTEADREGAPRVVIVNETLAARLWPGQNPIGKRFHFFDNPPVEVVGVARDAKYQDPQEVRQPYIYEPLAQRYVCSVTLIVRAESDPASLLPAIQRELRAMAPTLPQGEAMAVPDLRDRTLWAQQAGVWLLALFGLLALLLATVGLYGVMSFAVAQRGREIGLRMALGAQQGDVLRLVLRQGLTLVATGLAVGLALAFAVTHFAAGLLFGVSPTDPAAFGTTSVLLALAAFAATLVPALRAVSVDPLVALRYE